MIGKKNPQESTKHLLKRWNISDVFLSNAVMILMIIFFIGISVLLISNLFNVLNFTDLQTAITALASLMMAICSILNIILVQKQDLSHKKQIKELELSRKMQDRPLPWIRDVKINIEPPKLYYSFPENTCKYLSRYHILMEIENISDYPIPSLFVCALLKCAEDKGLYDGLYFGSDYKSGIPSHAKKQKLSLMCANDDDAKFYNSLRKEFPPEYPKLRYYMYYKSFSGGCFLLTQDFYVLPPEDGDEKTIVDWETSIASVKTKYANLFTNFTFYNEQMEIEKANEIYNELSEIIENEQISHNPWTIKLQEIPGKLNIKTLNEEEYNEYTNRINRWHLCGKKPSCLYTNRSKK